MATVPLWELRARFAKSLSVMYGEEVPAYNTLVDVSTDVNRDYLAAHGQDAERLGSIDRVTAERHGAIRVGSPEELRNVARVFAAFGMYPVGFYDLRDASASSVPVVSTAFRPIDRDELARNPFRVFCSMLAVEDPRFFSPELQEQLHRFIGERQLFPDGLLELADKVAGDGGASEDDADRLLALATSVFELGDEPVDHVWYKKLEKISAVAADIGGVSTTHINHLTPRVLDIDDLYRRMEDLGIRMIDEIQGPPGWDGPDVLLRQTSFKALSEDRMFRYEDGHIGPGELRVRFGEVEQRGIALTRAGRELYDEMVAETDRRLSELSGATRVEVARDVWQERLPNTETELAAEGLGFFMYDLAPDVDVAEVGGATSVSDLLRAGLVVAEPIVYEDFLPRSAAGIFQSNLTDAGSRDDAQQGVEYDMDTLSEIVGTRIADPIDLYAAQQQASIDALSEKVGIRLEAPGAMVPF